MADPKIRSYINESISGSPHEWPIEWFARNYPRRYARALSIGCGDGALERDLIKRDLVATIDAFDASINSLSVARRTAAEAGLGHRINYYLADFNEPVITKDAYDLILIHQALHHVAKIEKLYRQILGALRPGGLLYFDEYIGPSRFDWNERTVANHRALYALLPSRTLQRLPLPIQPDDPSEAFRSSEIMSLLRRGFTIEQQRSYGGNLLAVVYPIIDWQIAPPELVEQLIEAEKELLQGDALPFHAIVVARPKTGISRRIARAWYWLVPKLQRVRRELAARLKLRSSPG